MRDRSLGSTIRLKFTTTDSNGAPVAPSSAFVAADFRIYKDGSATEKTTTNGITVTSPFDSVTGRHLIEIDTSNATGDIGFWASGSAYFVELNTAKTVNSQAVSGLEIGSFSLELQTADIRKAGGTAITQSGGRMEVNSTHWAGTAVGSANVLIDGAITAAKIGADAITAAKIADGAIDTATFANGTTLPRVTLVDTCTANTDMRGTDNAALAATALSTAVWTSTIAGRIDVAISSRLAPTTANRTLTVDTTGAVALDSTTNTQIDNIENAAGYVLAVLAGACADPQTASETYAITVFGSTFTVDMAGQTSTGTRTAPTLTKT